MERGNSGSPRLRRARRPSGSAPNPVPRESGCYRSVICAGVLALNIFPGFCYPFLASPPGGGIVGVLRGLASYWLAMGLMGIFVCCTLLAVQRLCVLLLSRRLFLRLSAWIQLTAFFIILAAYFLRPPLPSHITADNLGITSLLPSFWFYTLWLKWNGDGSTLLTPFTARALWSLALTAAIGGFGFALAFRRSVHRMLEQPDIAPADRSRPAAPIGRFLARRLLARPLDRAILLFTARTMFRSRQHRLVLAAYAGVGMAIALVYVKDLLYGYSGGLWDSLGINGEASRHWDQVNVPFLAGSLVLLCFAIVGARAAFVMPIALPANWIFAITAVHNLLLRHTKGALCAYGRPDLDRHSTRILHHLARRPGNGTRRPFDCGWSPVGRDLTIQISKNLVRLLLSAW